MNYDESDIQIVSLETGERTTVHHGGSYPVYARSGDLLFARDYTVFAVQLDLAARTTRGLPVPVVQNVETSVGEQESDNGSANFDLSPQGTLIYRSASDRLESTRVGEFDFETGLVEAFGATAQHGRMTVSPDGTWLAIARQEDDEAEVYLFDLETRTEHRFTHMPGLDLPGCWSPDSKSLYWTHASGDGRYWAFRQPIDGSAPVDTVGGRHDNVIPYSVSGDGHWLLASVWAGPDGWEVTRTDLDDPEADMEPFIGGPGNQVWGAFSPDQRWVTFFSDESGDYELYLRRFPDTGAVWQLTPGDERVLGTAYWAPDGTSITVRLESGFASIPLDLTNGAVRIGRPVHLANDPATRIPSDIDYAMRPDQTGFYGLVGAETRGESASSIVVKTNWLPKLRAMVAGGR
jgi:Tol biopolymer transport system component